MSSPHTVTGAPAGRPAHAARPGPSPGKVAAVVGGLIVVVLAVWLAATVLLMSTGPTSTAPVSASLITVSLTPDREHPGLP